MRFHCESELAAPFFPHSKRAAGRRADHPTEEHTHQ